MTESKMMQVLEIFGDPGRIASHQKNLAKTKTALPKNSKPRNCAQKGISGITQAVK